MPLWAALVLFALLPFVWIGWPWLRFRYGKEQA
jgi:hypothetical protein